MYKYKYIEHKINFIVAECLLMLKAKIKMYQNSL